ncbi:hypothetical protein IJF86_03400 [Candidatus Saccharibacteria bacterium]|nr:hypothetical protein [Candidatus Saccharibacteria bacterium]
MFEINLVPDVKSEMLKAQKIRNIVLFVCLIVIAAAGGVIAILGGIKGGQDITMSSQDSRIEALSAKINSFDDLSELLTIQSQLNSLAVVSQEKVLLSRIFSIVSVMLPMNGDEISLSELTVDVEKNLIKFDAQADARVEPLIDYRVLDAFKKSMSMTKYDYGRYVDEEGNQIPVVCIVEADETGTTYNDNGSLYAFWTKGVKGCDPTDEEGNPIHVSEEEVRAAVGSSDTVKIWRTPQFENWYRNNYMSENGAISNVPHFESECTSYSMVGGRWTSNNTCSLLAEEVTISDSANARDSSGALVLRFSASIKYNPEVMLAKNKHMVAVAPSGYTNVTDSYIQIEGMFKKRADDCAEDDVNCLNS